MEDEQVAAFKGTVALSRVMVAVEPEDRTDTADIESLKIDIVLGSRVFLSQERDALKPKEHCTRNKLQQ